MYQKVLVIVFILSALTACVHVDSGQSKNEISSNDDSGKSPLAAHMRIMESHADELRRSLASGAKPVQRPAGLSNILTAEPTEGMHIDSASFPLFAADYLRKVDDFYLSAIGDRHDAYNAIVQSCDNCHRSHCPGPLLKIEKMYLKSDK